MYRRWEKANPVFEIFFSGEFEIRTDVNWLVAFKERSTAAAVVADSFAVVGDGESVATAVVCNGVIVPMLWESSLEEPIKTAAAAVVFADACGAVAPIIWVGDIGGSVGDVAESFAVVGDCVVATDSYGAVVLVFWVGVVAGCVGDVAAVSIAACAAIFAATADNAAVVIDVSEQLSLLL